MASVSVDSGGGGRKSVDHEIPLIPFIDLLLCCVMFLLVTAVWNQISSMEAQVNGPTDSPVAIAPPPEQPLTLQVGTSGFVLFSSAGDRYEIPATDGELDLGTLGDRLDERRRIAPNERTIRVSPDDDVDHHQIVATMDVLVGSGYDGVSFAGL